MKILVPIDFSETSTKALEMAISLTRGKKDDLLVAFVVEPVYDLQLPPH